MATRGRSVPATAFLTQPSSKLNNTDNTKAITTAIVPSPSSISTIPSNGLVNTRRNGSKLLAHADTLARMTIEYNVRAVSAQTERLEKSLSALMTCTKEDKAFRESHDARLQNMCQEILVVKQRMEEIQGPEWNSNGKVEPEMCKKEIDESIEQLRKEMGELRGLVCDISSTLDRLPTAAEAEALIRRTQVSTSTTKGSETQARLDDGKSSSEYSKHHSPLRHIFVDSMCTYKLVEEAAQSHVSIKQRIEDAIGSTRRWNRDHKTTKLSDAAFTANYLRQQSKRDPQMAVYIQRAIQRHVHRSGRPKAKARPKNLEQFCQSLVWRDIIETAEDVLVRNGGRTAKALGERTN